MKKLIFSLAVLTGFGVSAQDLPKCAEHTATAKWLQDNPSQAAEYYREQQEFNDFARDFELSNDSRARGVVYKIPIVFHIIHDYGVSNISDAQVMDGLEILNRDFRLLNGDASNVVATFQGMPADIEVEFVLATKKPNGQCFSGITRTASLQTDGTGSAQVSAVQSAHGNFPGDEYLNVFLVTAANGAAGYTYQPMSGSFGTSMNVGIFLQHSYFGSIGTGSTSTSRALTHEVGHWFRLSHTWGGTNNPGVSCGSDNVTDTPETEGWTSCTLTGTTCNGQLDNVENYMEYSYCSKMFTPGQKSRMRAALNNSTGGRNNLWTNGNLIATGADGTNPFCNADFTVERNYVCLNGSLQFQDASYNSVSNWNWTITGGTADDASLANPLVTFTTAGIQPVQMSANDGGLPDTELKADFIHVFPATPSSFPYSEDFESYGSLPAMGMITGFDDNPYPWELHNGVGSSGTKCIKFNNFTIPFDGLEREFVSYPIDLSGATAGDIELSFKSVYKTRDNMTSEKLYLFFSDDCGVTWTLSRQWFHSQLAQGNSNFTYSPTTSGEYMSNSHPIPASFKVSNFMYKFSWKNNGGNNIFIDDINIAYLGTAGIEDNELENISLYPNPFNDEITVQSSAVLNNSTIQIFDLSGKLVMSFKRDIVGKIVINTSELIQGMYIMEIKNDGYSKTFSIVK